MNKILLTGFTPFAEHKINPTEKIVQTISDHNNQIVGAILPVTYQDSFLKMRELIDQHSPTIILSLGLAAERSEATLERIAINCIDAKVADNNGITYQSTPVIQGGPDGIFSTLPLLKLTKELQDLGHKIAISNSAGTYVCNYLMYQTLYYLSQTKAGCRYGFLHIPQCPEEENLKVMEELVLDSITYLLNNSLQ